MKVLGASTSNIIFLFFKDFIWLILIAVIIGIPLIYWSMTDWLNGYAYRIDFPWWVILVAMILVTLLAFITVSWQTFKIASLNPAQTIKHE
ncbi:MAG: ABC transporter permease [Saprospiraceae bacterium]